MEMTKTLMPENAKLIAGQVMYQKGTRVGVKQSRRRSLTGSVTGGTEGGRETIAGRGTRGGSSRSKSVIEGADVKGRRRERSSALRTSGENERCCVEKTMYKRSRKDNVALTIVTMTKTDVTVAIIVGETIHINIHIYPMTPCL